MLHSGSPRAERGKERLQVRPRAPPTSESLRALEGAGAGVPRPEDGGRALAAPTLLCQEAGSFQSASQAK